MVEYKATLAILAAIVSHTMMGAGPALTRYLQTNAVRPISALSLLALGNLLVLALYTPRILYKIGRNLYLIRQQLIQIKLKQFNEALEQKISLSGGLAETLGARTELQENVETSDRSTISKTVFKQSEMTWETIKVALLETKQFVFTLPILLITVLYLVRTITQTMATNYARANQVQLIDMFTPFFIAIFTSLLLQNNQYMNLTSAISLLLTAAGGILIVFGMEREDTPGFHWRINWELVAKGITWSQLFGISLAAIALVAGSWQLALKHHTSFKFTQQAIANSQNQEVIVIEKEPRTGVLTVAPDSVDKMKLQVMSSENSFIVQNLAMVLLLVPLSLLFSDWTVWKEISYVEWTVFIVYSLMVFMFSNMCQSFSIKYVGSTRYSLLYSLRLVSTITLSWLLLNEQMNNILQIVGAGIVILSSLAYTIYLLREENRAKLQSDANVILESKNIAAAPIPAAEEIQLSKLQTEIEIQQQQAQDVKIAVVEAQPPAVTKTEVTIEEVKQSSSS